MKRLVQRALLTAYRWALGSRILSTRVGKALFQKAYWAYKEWIESGEVDLLRRYVIPGQDIVDVGANIGFFTLKFARWVSKGGRVIAIEPEQQNFDSLVEYVSRAGCGHNVSAVHAAAAERSGELKLAINPNNPADHWLSESGTTVPATTIDELLSRRGWPRVCLIKIDVQGAESRVLAGARETLSKYHPPLFVEIDEAGLHRGGTSARSLIEDLAKSGYRPHVLEKGDVSARLEPDAALARVHAKGYTDILFLWQMAKETR